MTVAVRLEAAETTTSADADPKIPKSSNPQLPKSPNRKSPNLQITKFANLQVSKSPNLQVAGYNPQLDGLRALAVLAVAWSHWERPYQFGIPFGAGVHLFYVLSGFLITGILLRVRDEADRGAALWVFYLRRSLRIFPAFYLTLLLAWLADVPLVRESVAWHLTFLSNVFTFFRGEWPGMISHFWSLAVEEQFYLAWLIVFAPRQWLLPSVGCAIAVAPLFRWWLAGLGYPETVHAVLTPGCLDSLGVGALIALWSADGRPLAVRRRSLVWIGLPAWLGALALEQLGVRLPIAIALKQTLQACVFAWLVLRAAEGFGGLTGRALSAAPVVYIGRISYGLYLAHGFAGALARTLMLAVGRSWPVPEPLRFFVLCALTLAVASVSWRLLERPLMARRPSLATGREKSSQTSLAWSGAEGGGSM